MNSLYLYTSSRFNQLPKSFSIGRQVPWWDQVLDPRSEFVAKWNQVFLVTCLVALFLDPLYFYLPIVGGPACMTVDYRLGVSITFLRTVADFFFIVHIMIKLRIAFVAPSSRVFGRGELVVDRKAIAKRYFKSTFVIDLAAALPLPQIVIWFVLPSLSNPSANHTNHTVTLIVLIQYVPRLCVMFPLNRRIIKATGVVARTPWSGAAYNILLYCLASHVLGASWYLLSLQRQQECWKMACKREMNTTNSPSCHIAFLDCGTLKKPDRDLWLKNTRVITGCDARNDDDFQFVFDVGSNTCFLYFSLMCSSYGQNLETSIFVGETLFSICVSIAGLILFSHLIGKIQTYLQSTTARLEEWRVRRRDTEEWMRHRQLPPELQERVRRFVQYKWLATRGVDEESILRSLPLDVRRQIQSHLCLALVRRVPLFAQMDGQLLDAICERLYSSLNTKDTFIIREGDPVSEMLFIIRGQVESSTTNGGRSGFYNSITLGAGDFCGEELLTWALLPSSTLNLPLSTRTVKCNTEVEAFALRAEDLKFVSSQFKRLHSKKLQHAFRYHSHQWRTWGACFIQAAWRRFIKRKKAMELAREESLYYAQYPEYFEEGDYSDESPSASGHVGGSSSSSEERPLVDSAHKMQNLSATILASKFAANTRRGATQKMGRLNPDASSLKMPKLFKPQEPDFS
ncbi:hypothetical protein JRO89_XS13G0191000 [Xanthoceras sorbifolium]|uniref:Cyclic nucleotide-binding domain-containing protein n=1 Tax=Xanthoceras sorbifolium TaxID=99658 RepID=A0ABQ8H931_9ROSI|nr:hypothetical protein JRO89_XS13G0191000 [Xanthoceras sorbifolium]